MPDTAVSAPRDRTELGFDPSGFLPHHLSVVANRYSATLHGMYASRFGLTVPGWRIMAILAGEAPLSSRDVGDRLAMDPVAISRAVDQLVTAGLVSRRTDPDDRRRHQLRLTDRGRAVFDEIVPLAHGIERAILETLEPADREALARIMRTLATRSADILAEGRDWREFLG